MACRLLRDDDAIEGVAIVMRRIADVVCRHHKNVGRGCDTHFGDPPTWGGIGKIWKLEYILEKVLELFGLGHGHDETEVLQSRDEIGRAKRFLDCRKSKDLQN